ncbi:putative signal transducing protein [Thermosulfidibacter takaii]|uniref:putative signal transducing protein n=1 Tax=Thermosulfidibacter takaii TaxID=412593 RepID=UPI0009F877C6|nr:DUF2007 domain-containing protein [Thermosulfidibacter takaii]
MWVKIAEISGITEAQIVKGLLESQGIPVKLRYETAAALFGIRMNGIGKVEVMVPAEYKNAAQQILVNSQHLDNRQTKEQRGSS